MIKNIVFDMGGVIIDYTPRNIVKNYSDDPIIQDKIKEELFDSPYWLMFDAGVIDEDQLYQEVSANVYASMRPLLKEVITSWYKYLPEFPIADLIGKLKDKGYDLYLLSNASIQFENYCDNISVLKDFKGIYVSGFHRLIKPGYFIYHDFLEEFKLEGKECLFIDDVYENVEGAGKAGMKGIVHDGDLDHLATTLTESGLL